jgi:tetratricopeptide (TPR) repeat protein
VDVQIRLGDCLLALGQYEEAARAYDQAFDNKALDDKMDRDWLRAEAATGAAKALAPRCPKSKTLEGYLERDPQNIIIAHRQAHCLQDEGKTAEARTLFEVFSERFKDYEENNSGKNFLENQLFHLGEIHKKAGHHDRAVACLERVITNMPLWPEAHLYQAESLAALGDSIKAVHHYNLAFDTSTGNPDSDWIRTQSALAVANINANEYLISETLKNHLDRDAQNEILAYATASALENEGRTAESRQLFEKFTLSFKKDHLRANAWFRLARLSPANQQKPFLVECLKLAPDHGGARKLMGELDCNKQLV